MGSTFALKTLQGMAVIRAFRRCLGLGVDEDS
jgi:hypothetical protein